MEYMEAFELHLNRMRNGNLRLEDQEVFLKLDDICAQVSNHLGVARSYEEARTQSIYRRFCNLVTDIFEDLDEPFDEVEGCEFCKDVVWLQAKVMLGFIMQRPEWSKKTSQFSHDELISMKHRAKVIREVVSK